jgi:hypothetical protein
VTGNASRIANARELEVTHARSGISKNADDIVVAIPTDTMAAQLP